MVIARDAAGRFVKKGTNGDKSQTIYMPIKQASDGKTAAAEAIVVKKEKNAKKGVCRQPFWHLCPS